ncbi:MAG: phosphatidylserine decarboxylase family protein [Candidatus Hydrogenedentes bacterium]|nr:phosphatidylserine decarboxylase family protein [Candidatus Hydrogenedentota bacterium]
MNKPFSGWREGAKFYIPVLVLGIVLLFALMPLGYGWIGVAVVLLGVAMALFFRDFPRNILAASHEIVSPADGTIVAIEDLDQSPFYEGPCKRISIFLSVLSVHVNRAPCACTVKAIKYTPGQFINAMSGKSSEVNEANTLWLDTEFGPMTVRQISGLVARRIVCPVQVGAKLTTGEKFGMIRFGSRTELYLPPNAEVLTRVRAKVAGGTSVLARFS